MRGCRQGRAKLAGAAEKMIGLVETLLDTRRRIVTCPQPYPGMEEDLNRLLPPGFLAAADFERLPHLCRYLKGVVVRADRARGDTARDRRKAQLVAPYQQALDELCAAADPGNEGGPAQDRGVPLASGGVAHIGLRPGAGHGCQGVGQAARPEA